MSGFPHPEPPPVPPAGRFIGAVFGLVFFGIGVTVLVFLWGQPFGGFGAPPLVFRLFGSFIALAFLAVGGTVCVAAIRGKRGLQRHTDIRGTYLSSSNDTVTPPPSHPASKPGYHCPRCSAPLADGADVSPHGDVKCTYCNAWFNVHGK